MGEKEEMTIEWYPVSARAEVSLAVQSEVEPEGRTRRAVLGRLKLPTMLRTYKYSVGKSGRSSLVEIYQ